MEKILIIDDEKPTLSMFRLFLGAYGYSALTAENGPEALEIFKREKPPIVFTDIKMPGMDGLAVLKAIKEIDPLTQVVVITGHGDMELAVKALDLDATDFINKPVQRAALDAALKRAEERFKLGMETPCGISHREAGPVRVMEISGNIRAEAKTPLLDGLKAVTGGGAKALVLCFDDNFSINGEGIAAVMNLLTDCKKTGLPVALSGVSENFKLIFEMVGITRLADLYDTEEGAIKAVS